MSDTTYRIVAKIDPQTGAGSAKVKQDLKGVQQEARATEQALNRSFDHARFERTIGGLVKRIESLDSSINKLAGSNSTLTRSNETLGQSLDRMAASSGKATAKTDAGGKAADEAAGKNAQYEAALMRVLRAVDQDAAEQARLNAVLADAKRLLDAGVISQERYAQVQKLAAGTADHLTARTGAQRAGMQQLGYQLGDVATMYSLGAKPAQIFASQIGQVTQAAQLMAGGTSKFAAFLSGPWGIALTVAVIMLAPFVSKLLEGNDALGDSIEKLKKDAQETELNRRAKEAFNRTLEGQIALQRDLNDEMEKGLQSQRQQQQANLRDSESRLDNMRRDRGNIAAQITEAQKRLNELTEQLRSPPPFGADQSYMTGLIMAIDRAETKVKDLRASLAQRDRDISDTERGVRAARVPIQEDNAQAAADPIAGINKRYDQMRDSAVAAALGNERLSRALEATLTSINKQRKAALDAAQAQMQLNKAAREGVGVATFRSREQAIGIAGRELQQGGLRVSENSQFGGVKATHPGMGNAAHGRYAIDVNAPGSQVEANVPDLRARFDAMANRYAARGYKVLWNGNIYWPDGKVTKIAGGQNQHRDHMHLEAPGTIVGKATQASTEAQARQEDEARAKVAERAEDFVQAVVDKQATVGIPADRQSQINAQINEALAEFQRRFDREATTGERATISKAFTDADARDTALRFDDAYVKPLTRLKALQGAVGIERDILNAKLDETLRLGRELTPVEAAMIENGIRQEQGLKDQAQALEKIKAPLQAYIDQIAVLEALLKRGDISQRQFNAGVAALGKPASGVISEVAGIDPNTGRNYADIAAINDENTRYAEQLAAFEANREQILKMGIDYDALEEAARRQHIENLAKIDAARKDQQLAAVQDIAGSMLSILENTIGKQNALYKTMFAIEKAVAIARSIVAIQTGIAQAAALPFPANLGAIASVVAATASIVANIQAVALNFKDGGPVVGPGGPRSDSVPANLSNGEYVINASAARRNRALLDAINAGQTITASRAANVAVAQQAAPARGRITVQQHPGVSVETRENLTTGDVEIIASRVLDQRGGAVMAAQIADPNSRVRKALVHHTTTRGRKT